MALSGACAVEMLAADADAESETAPMSVAPSAVGLVDSKAVAPAAARSSRSTTRLRPIRRRPPHFCHLGSASMLAALVCAVVALVLYRWEWALQLLRALVQALCWLWQ